MRKLFLMLALAVISVTAFSQVKYFDGTLAEAVAKAKNEDKKVLIMASATW